MVNNFLFVCVTGNFGVAIGIVLYMYSGKYNDIYF